MLIRRIEVEGGFLDGLDLRLEPGLNVIIGARGSGKTSLLELIRYCVGSVHISDVGTQRSESFAVSVLGDGRVTLSAELGDSEFIFSRAAGEPRPQVVPSISVVAPTVLSQNEIETIANDAKGRLRLIDGRSPTGDRPDGDERALLSRIGSLTAEMDSVRKEIDNLQQQIADTSAVRDALKEARAQHLKLAEQIRGLESEQKRLREIEASLAASGVRAQYLERLSESVSSFMGRIAETKAVEPGIEPWPSGAGEQDLSAGARSKYDQAVTHLADAVRLLAEIHQEVSSLEDATNELRVAMQDEARKLRRSLDELSTGSGAASRRVASLQEQVSQLEALEQLLVTKRERLAQLGVERGELLDSLERARTQRAQSRVAICKDLSSELGPRIRAQLSRGGQRHAYVSALSKVLRGSGLHYNTLAPQLAQEMSPRELVESAETGDFRALVDIGGVDEDRARRLVIHLGGQGLGSILTAEVEDDVELSLLDGKEYKLTDQLSTGQRCTVILPILLARHRNLVVDQPEDNLDNAFIVDTVIQAVGAHTDLGSDAQLIFATHNANIPVLGNATRVVRMGSDGKRGFALHQGALDDPEIIDAITSVMEGGLEAFKRRAVFYETRELPPHEP